MHMSTIGSVGPGGSELATLQSVTRQLTDETADAAATSAKAETTTPVEGIKVSLSAAGMDKATGKDKPNRDIEESGLPNNVQETLKRIRELKQQIAEKMAEMQALMSDPSLTPEMKQSRVGALQTTLATLNAGLMTANNALTKAIKDSGLSKNQSTQAATLSMK
jgi:hypothetical protein